MRKTRPYTNHVQDQFWHKFNLLETIFLGKILLANNSLEKVDVKSLAQKITGADLDSIAATVKSSGIL